MKRTSVCSVWSASCFAVATLCIACSSDDGGETPTSPSGVTSGSGATTGAAGARPTSGGTGAVTSGQGTAGSSAAAGGSSTAVAGTAAPSGGAAGATSGAAGGGTAGATAAAGAGAAGASAGGATNTCGAASTATPAELYAAAAAILLPSDANKRCAFGSCHDTKAKKANLILGDEPTVDLVALTVDKVACEAPNLKVVDKAGGDTGLKNSWLWHKLTGATDPATNELVPDTTWGTPGTCGQSGTGYGVRMPFGNPDPLPEASLTAVKNWICAGAPK